jgi:hypothetical protein
MNPTTTTTSLYPDVLGALAVGARAAFGPLQCALGVRPAAVAAGKAFEVVLLAQNTCDATVDLVAALTLPETDHKRQKGKFLPPRSKPVVAVKAGEVGCLILPVATLPDIAPGEYKLSVDVGVKAPSGTGRVRSESGSFAITMLSEDGRAHFEELRGIPFSTNKPRLRSALETSFTIGAPRPALPPELKPDWITLWSLADGDDRMVLAHYGETLIARVFPQLKRTLVYPVLMDATLARYEKAGFPLKDAEAALITKVMTLILEYASPRERGHGFQAAGKHAIEPLLANARKDPTRKLKLPRWMGTYLRLIARDDRAADAVVKLLGTRLYLPLLRDAIEYSFDLVSQTSGQIMGDEEDIARYSDSIVRALEEGEMDFERAYLPLVLGGVILNDKLLMPGEIQDEKVSYLLPALKEREPDIPEKDADVLDLTYNTIQRATKIYGSREE